MGDSEVLKTLMESLKTQGEVLATILERLPPQSSGNTALSAVSTAPGNSQLAIVVSHNIAFEHFCSW